MCWFPMCWFEWGDPLRWSAGGGDGEGLNEVILSGGQQAYITDCLIVCCANPHKAFQSPY